MPILNINNKLHILFEKRSFNLNIQPGEICFPGGGIEPVDNTPLDTAIRETCEELNIYEDDIEVLLQLDYEVSPFNAIIYPYVALIKDQAQIIPNKDEVEKIFCVPLEFFLTTEPRIENLKLEVRPLEGFPFDLIPDGKKYKFRIIEFPQTFYIWENEVIWGLTARILCNFIDLYKQNIDS
ncbi:putative nudix hydrolase YeaB [Candidatus Syntrophocurvum alkaliphilum]|uniref:Putative nudix hydrolase YeaB n=1 Tax=Candidatus Syntrophocurvum alkaliphilum TaxID=2293317 RepID=A0A6I6D8Z9_9FIRM|nr:CoA pyrophosphatase [Candidatus Syntrophocurvum alkaliphilum]QGT99408.1 putative nudix hydrolase YeaB [Candidatus Syntrophocurvum alkaliphilum]